MEHDRDGSIPLVSNNSRLGAGNSAYLPTTLFAMKKLYAVPLLATFLLANAAKAQSFSLDPGPVVYVVAPFNNLSIFDIYQQNLLPDSLLLQWSFVSMDLPAGWDYSMCDLGHCYPGIPGGEMFPFGPGEMGFLGLNINPSSISGTGSVQVYVYDVNFPDDGNTLTWIVSTTDLGIGEQAQASFNVFPNPSNDQCTVQLDKPIAPNNEILVRSLDGRTVTRMPAGPVSTIPTSQLPSGTYTVSLMQGGGTLMVRTLVVNH
jgi:hypothetical protein